MTSGFVEAIFESPGFATGLALEPAELERIREMIRNRYLERWQEVAPDAVDRARKTPLEDYHTLAHCLDHSRTWPKSERLLQDSEVAEFRRFSVMKELEEIFGTFEISNEEEIYREEIYWRIVRPNEPSDTGPAHADKWFWDLGHGSTPSGKTRIKVWIPIHAEPGKSGLVLYPNTHKRNNWDYVGVKSGPIRRPQIKTSLAGLASEEFTGNCGRLVLFHDELLHRGMPNVGTKTRFSLEFTLFVDNSVIPA